MVEIPSGPKLCRCLIFEVRGEPLKSAKPRGYSSAGRAPALQAGGHRFDPDYLHQGIEGLEANRRRYGLIAQLVRASA